MTVFWNMPYLKRKKFSRCIDYSCVRDCRMNLLRSIQHVYHHRTSVSGIGAVNLRARNCSVELPGCKPYRLGDVCRCVYQSARMCERSATICTCDPCCHRGYADQGTLSAGTKFFGVEKVSQTQSCRHLYQIVE